jgi:lysozyme family protein
MSANFDKAFAAIVGVEGVYSNDPKDPGGETKFGITKRSYPQLDIKALTLADAKSLYLKDYWGPIHGDDIPWPLAMFVFDAEVNQGRGAAIKLLQKSLGVKQDGSFGPSTVKAVAKANHQELCSLFMADRALRYTGTRNFDTFGRGWLARLFRVVITAT